MAVATDAGPRESSGHIETSGLEASRSWTNIRPLDRSPAGAVGQWIELLASISHELRTPLNAVIGFSDAMQQEVFGPIGNARYREYVGHIRTSGVELLQAAEDALAMTAVLAQPKAVTLVDLMLAPIVAEVIAELGHRDAGRGVEIIADIDETIDIRADQRILTRAIRQLAAIGLSRAAPGSTVRIIAAVEHGLVDLRVEVDALADDALPLVELSLHNRPSDLGLGRRELAIWLAIALLDLIDCRLDTEARGGGMSLRTTFEQSRQASFFADGAQ